MKMQFAEKMVVLVHGVGGACGKEGISVICRTAEATKRWMTDMVEKGAVVTVTRWVQAGILVAALFGAGMAQAAGNPGDLAQMSLYADNAIRGAVLNGNRKVTLTFGNAAMDLIEKVGDALAAKGYKIDQQAFLLNPLVLRLYHLPKRETLAREGGEPMMQSPVVRVADVRKLSVLDAAVEGE